MQFLQQIFGDQGARYVSFLLAFVTLLIVVMLLWMLVRKAMGDRINFSDRPDRRGRAPRLAVTESFSIGAQGRRLVMVRRDNVEHLLMIGGPNDVVIESNVVRGERPVVARLGDRQPEAEVLPFAEPAAQVAMPQPKAPPRMMAPAPVQLAPAPLPLAPMEIKKEPPKPVEMPQPKIKLPEPPDAVAVTVQPPQPASQAIKAPVVVAAPIAPPVPAREDSVTPPVATTLEPVPVPAPAPPAPSAPSAPARKGGSLAERLMSGLRGKAAAEPPVPAPAKASPKAAEDRSIDALKQELEALDRMATTPPPARIMRPEPPSLAIKAPEAPKVAPAGSAAKPEAAPPAPPIAPPAVETAVVAVDPPAAPPPAIKARPAAETARPMVRNPFDSLEEEMAKLLGRSGEGKK